MEENKDQIGQTPQVPQDDISNQSFQDVIAQANEIDEKAEKEVEEPKEEKVEEKVETPPPPPENKPEAPQAPVIDEEKLTNNIVEKVLEAQKKDNTTEEQDELTMLLKDAEMRAKAEGRQITYQEALKIVSDVNKKQVKEEIMADLQKEADEAEREEKEAQEAQTKQFEEVKASWNQYWDKQFQELEADGKIPSGEEGKKVRLELLETMQKVSQERQANGQQAILNIKEIFAFHYKPKEDRMADKKKAPVFTNETTVASKPALPTDEQLANMDIRQVRMLAEEIDNS